MATRPGKAAKPNATDANRAAMELFVAVCENGGVLELGNAVSKLTKKSKAIIQAYGAAKFIEQCFPKIFKLLRKPKGTRIEVEAIMPFKFCPQAAEKSGGCPMGMACTKLHLCPYFIKGSCTYKEKCRLSHDLRDIHTLSLLRALNLAGLDDNLWFQLLKKVLADTEIERGASNHDIPEICKFYNNQGGCIKNDKCSFLHVCQHYVDGSCKFGEGCKRDHNLLGQPHNREVFKVFRLNSFNSAQLLSVMRGRERKRTTSSSSDSSIPRHAVNSAGSNLRAPAYSFVPNVPMPPSNNTESHLHASTGTDICGFHLRGQCNYGPKCINLHRDLPYQWQFSEKTHQLCNADWTDFSADSNIMLEHAFCDLTANQLPFCIQGQSYTIAFEKMVAYPGHAGLQLDIRRLSTQSSAEASPGHIFSTRWVWYWQDETGKWQAYDTPEDGFEPNTTCSISLEKDFLQGKESHPFSAGHHSYNIYYKKMVQKNLIHQTERMVRRRPEFVAKEKMNEIAKRRKEDLKASSMQSSISVPMPSRLPPHWEENTDSSDFARIPLSLTSQEYKQVEKKFVETMSSVKRVKTIERIQNPDLWIQYIQKKERMEKKANNASELERQNLFHGTTTNVIDAICQQGFDWRMCGRHGTVYGKGSYFACASSYSHRYTDHTAGNDCYMFAARVLVGSYKEGDKTYTRPPPRDVYKPYGELYDSCVNDVLSPGLFVTFDNSQSYPEYLITYRN